MVKKNTKTDRTKKSDKCTPWFKVEVKEKPYQIKSIEKKEKFFLIVCEGESEEYYFNAFPVSTAVIKPVSTGMSNLKLVEYAEDLSKLEDYKGYEVWCVFDFDIDPNIENQKQDYDLAIEYASEQGFKVAYSNDAFEIWYVLHYKDTSGELHRDVYFDFLGDKWEINYRKSGKKIEYARTIYLKLVNDTDASQSEAIKRAKRLFENQKDKPYSAQNPCTTVYQLVEELNEHLKK